MFALNGVKPWCDPWERTPSPSGSSFLVSSSHRWLSLPPLRGCGVPDVKHWSGCWESWLVLQPLLIVISASFSFSLPPAFRASVTILSSPVNVSMIEDFSSSVDAYLYS